MNWWHLIGPVSAIVGGLIAALRGLSGRDDEDDEGYECAACTDGRYDECEDECTCDLDCPCADCD